MFSTYSVLGSCVTRDAADLGANPLPRPQNYFSRTKVESLVSTPTAITVSDIGLSSKFQTRVVVEDHLKTALPVIASLKHPLIIDLIDERFELLDSGTGLVTESLPFRQSLLSRLGEYKPVERDATLAMGGPFATAARALAAILPGVPVIIHRAYWATESADRTPLAKADLAVRTNDWLSRAYRVLESSIPGAVVVEPGPEVTVADPEHRWGIAPFHYPSRYYDLFRSQVLAALT